MRTTGLQGPGSPERHGDERVLSSSSPSPCLPALCLFCFLCRRFLGVFRIYCHCQHSHFLEEFYQVLCQVISPSSGDKSCSQPLSSFRSEPKQLCANTYFAGGNVVTLSIEGAHLLLMSEKLYSGDTGTRGRLQKGGFCL